MAIKNAALALWLLAGLMPARGAAKAEAPLGGTTYWSATAQKAEERLLGLKDKSPADLSAAQNVEAAWQLSRWRADDDKALAHALAAIEKDADNYKAHEIAGRIRESRGDYSQAFEHFMKLITVDRPESTIYLTRMDRLNPSAAQRHARREAVRAAIDDPAIGETYRAVLRDRLARIEVTLGNVDAAAAQLARLHFHKLWMVIGPFDNEQNAGYSRVDGPESEIDYDKTYDGRDRPVRWRRLEHFDLAGQIDFRPVMYPQDNVLAYALTFLHAEADTPVVLRVGAANAVKLWLNDRLVLADDLDKRYVLDQFNLPCRLKKGWNKLLVKVCERRGEWKLGLRVTMPDGSSLAAEGPDGEIYKAGEPLPIRRTPSDADGAAPAAFEYAGSAYDTFFRRADADPQNPAALFYLAQAEALSGRRERVSATIERLITLNPQCAEHHEMLASAYEAEEKPDKQLQALKRILEINPDQAEAQVRLAMFYQRTEKPDDALEIIDRVVKKRPEWLDARYARQLIYKGKRWEEHAYREAVWMNERHPDVEWVPGAYAAQAADRGYRDEARAGYEAAVRLRFDDQDARRALIGSAEQRGEIDAAAAHYREMLRVNPLAQGLRLSLAHLLTRAKRFDHALAVCDEALAVCPENSAVHRLRGQILQRMNKDEGALEAWKLALQYNPDDKWLREYIEFLQPQSMEVFAKFGLPDDEAAEIVRRRVDPADYPKADAVDLLDHAVVELHEDGSYTALDHRIAQVLNENGREDFTTVRLRGGETKIKRAVVIQPDGAEVEATAVSAGSISFGQLQPGSIVEYRVQHRGSANEWLSRHYTTAFGFQGGSPRRRAQFILVAPPSRKIKYYLQGERAKLTRGSFEGKDVFDFRADDVPMLEPERNRPPIADIADMVAISTIPSWDEIARWEHALIKESFTADEAILDKVRELTADARTHDEKVRALAGFVCQKVQYRQDYLRPILGMQPHKAGNVLVKEAGDCKDKATLLITMLRAAGIRADYVTLRTRPSGRMLEEIPMNQCDHAIIFVPDPADPENGQYIDGTALENGIDSLPWQDQGVSCLVFEQSGAFRFSKTPVAPPEQNQTAHTLNIDLRPDGSADVRARWRATGQWAATLRQTLKVPGQRKRLMEQFANLYFPGARLGDVEVGDLEDREAPVEVRYRFEAPNVAQPDGERLVIRQRAFLEMTRRYADRSERTYDIWLPFTQLVSFEERYRLPPGFKVADLPEATERKSEWLDFTLTVRPEDGRVVLSKRVMHKAVLVPRTAFETWRQLCVDIDQAERLNLAFVPGDMADEPPHDDETAPRAAAEKHAG